jgi:hypothetical protein
LCFFAHPYAALDRPIAIVLLTAPSLRSDSPPTFDDLSALRGEAQRRRYGRHTRLACFYRRRIGFLGFYLCLFIVADTVAGRKLRPLVARVNAKCLIAHVKDTAAEALSVKGSDQKISKSRPCLTGCTGRDGHWIIQQCGAIIPAYECCRSVFWKLGQRSACGWDGPEFVSSP